MGTTSTALSYFLNGDLNNQNFIPDLLQNEELNPVKEEISRALKKKAIPKDYFNKMIGHISELLHIDLRAVILNAWCSSGKFSSYLDTQNYSPHETIIVPLAEHTIKSVHTPSIKPTFNNIPLGEIRFTINLELKIGGASLTIKNGKIAAFSIGSCRVAALFMYNDFIILQKEGTIPQIGTEINLADGIDLRETAETIHNTISALNDGEYPDNKNQQIVQG